MTPEQKSVTSGCIFVVGDTVITTRDVNVDPHIIPAGSTGIVVETTGDNVSPWVLVEMDHAIGKHLAGMRISFYEASLSLVSTLPDEKELGERQMSELRADSVSYPVICRNKHRFSDETILVIAMSDQKTVFLFKNGSVADRTLGWPVGNVLRSVNRGSWLVISKQEAIRYCNQHKVPTEQLINELGNNSIPGHNNVIVPDEKEMRRRRDEQLKRALGF
jgi:hypothetical protein